MPQFPTRLTPSQQRHLSLISNIYTSRSRAFLDAAHASDTTTNSSSSLFSSVSPSQVKDEDEQAITIVCISDTHDALIRAADIPMGDVLIHAGDLTGDGSVAAVKAQIDWLKGLRGFRWKVVVAGNHDSRLDCAFVSSRQEKAGRGPVAGHEGGKDHEGDDEEKKEIDWGEIVYLQDESTTLHFPNGRQLNVYGSPYTPRFGTFAFQYDPKRESDERGGFWHNKIPSNADIVVTHGPPAYHLDSNIYGGHVGCLSLLAELERVKPKLVVCGHIHEAHGEEVLAWDSLQSAWERALSNRGTASDVIVALRCKMIGTRISKDRATTRLVNAAIAGENGRYQQPIVVRI